MRVILNGQDADVLEGITVAQVLADRGLAPVRVAVEINEDLVPRRAFEQTEIRDGDRIEIVTLVGGG